MKAIVTAKYASVTAVGITIVTLLCMGVPTFSNMTGGSPQALTCSINIPAVIGSLVGDDVAPFVSTKLSCDYSLVGATVEVSYVSDPHIQLNESSARTVDNVYDFGFNLGLVAHTGENTILVEVTGPAGGGSYEFNFNKDDEAPSISLSETKVGTRIDVVESQTAITNISLVLRDPSNARSFLELDLIKDGSPVSGAPLTDRQRSFHIPQLGSNDDGILLAQDGAGNSRELYLGSTPETQLRNEYDQYLLDERRRLVETMRASQNIQDSGTEYGFRFAVLVTAPSQEMGNEPAILDRLKAAIGNVEGAVKLLDEEFILNNRPVPGLVEKTMKDLQLFLRFSGENTAQAVNKRAVNNNKLRYFSPSLRGLNFVSTSEGVFTKDSGGYGYGVINPVAFLDIQDYILREAFPASPLTGAERLIVICDDIEDQGLRPAGITPFRWPGASGQTVIVKTGYRQGEPPIHPAYQQTIVHELGHSAKLEHAVDTREAFSLPRKPADFVAGKKTVMYRSLSADLMLFTYPQLLQFQNAFWGLSDGSAQRPIESWSGYEASNRWRSDYNSGNEQFLYPELLASSNIFDRSTFPPSSPSRGDLPPFYSSYYTHPPTGPETLPDRGFAAILYGLFDPETVRVRVPAGALDPSTGRLPLFHSYELESPQRDLFQIAPGTKVVRVGVIPLSNSIFEPFHENTDNRRRLPTDNGMWLNQTGEGISIVEIPVTPNSNYLSVRVVGYELSVALVTDAQATPAPQSIRAYPIFQIYPERRKHIPVALVYSSDELIPEETGADVFNTPENEGW